MIAAIHRQEVLALQAASSVIALHALFVLPGFFAASWAIPDAATSRTATAATAPNSFALALTSLSPNSSTRNDLIPRLVVKNNCGCGAPGAAAKTSRWIARLLLLCRLLRLGAAVGLGLYLALRILALAHPCAIGSAPFAICLLLDGLAGSRFLGGSRLLLRRCPIRH